MTVNSHIQELALQAWKYTADETAYLNRLHNRTITQDEITDIFEEKFAQMIVRECVKEIEFQYGGGSDQPMDNEWDRAIECVSSMVKYRFGVE